MSHMNNILSVVSIPQISSGIRELEAPKYKCEAPIIGGLGVETPAGSRGRAPGQGGKLKHFWLLNVH